MIKDDILLSIVLSTSLLFSDWVEEVEDLLTSIRKKLELTDIRNSLKVYFKGINA